MGQPPYRRVLLKLSGEALQGNQGFGVDRDTLRRICGEIAEATRSGVQIGLVVGGGNIFRGLSEQARDMDRVTADYMGMLATVINSLAIEDALKSLGIDARAMTSFEMRPVAETYTKGRALKHLEAGRVAIFAGGTGNPFFSTDTAAALRALEIGAQALLKATKVDGVYDSDPVINPGAKRFETLDFDQVIQRRLMVMDLTAVSMCRDNNLPIVVFNLLEPGSLHRLLVLGERLGTTVGP